MTIGLKDFFGMNEGARDEEFRQRAMEISDQVREALADARSAKVEQKVGRVRVIFDLEKLVPGNDDTVGLDFAFTLVPAEEHGGGFYVPAAKRAGRALVELRFPNDPAKHSPFTPDSWKKHVLARAGNIFSKNKSAVRHELIHHLDVTRTGRMGKKVKAGTPEYYGEPFELNAFIQMGLADMADKLRHVRTKEGAKMLMGSTPQEFFKRVLRKMDPQFIAHLSDPNRRKLAKRAYQMWDDVLSKLK